MGREGLRGAGLLLQVEGALPCTIVRRVNRFVVEVVVEEEPVRAYINNTGRLSGYLEEGRVGFCQPFAEPQKTQVRLFAIEDRSAAALIDTQWQMRALERAVGRGWIPWLAGWRIARRSPRLGKSVLDYLLARGEERLYLEVKSAVLREGDVAMYPDCPTRRGRRHIAELTAHVAAGGRGAVGFVAALPGVRAFRPSAAGDPEIPALLREAAAAGVLVRACQMHYRPDDGGVYLDAGALNLSGL